MLGMSNTFGGVIVAVYPNDDGSTHFVQWSRRHGITDLVEPDEDDLPNLNDPATLGCIGHGLLAELPNAPISLVFDGEKWVCSDVDGLRVARLDGRSFWTDRHRRSTRFDSKADALVAALEATPHG
jgi:hypothetical protein